MMTSKEYSELSYNIGDLVGDPMYPTDDCNLGVITRVVETLYSVKYEVAWQKPQIYKGKLWDHYEVALVQRFGTENE
jgi:hypothetical protein